MEILLSFFPSFLILFFCIFIFVVLPKANAQRSRRLIEYYGGKLSWPLGVVTIVYNKVNFKISRVARGSGYTGLGGSFPVLWTYVSASPKLIFGNESCHKFTTGQFLIMPDYKLIEVAGKKYLLGCEDPKVLNELEVRALKPELGQIASALFPEKFHHLTLSQKRHFIGWSFRRNYVLTYVALNESIYAQPEELRAILDQLSEFCEILNLGLLKNIK